MEGKLVGVIVPIYKAEKDLRRCIASIVEQSYHNLQIILVNDALNLLVVIYLMNMQRKISE